MGFNAEDEKTMKKTQKDGYIERLYPSIESYSGVLAGVTDRPSCTFVFPPPGDMDAGVGDLTIGLMFGSPFLLIDNECPDSAYTWPLEKTKMVRWVSFNFPADTKIKLKLMQGSTEFKSMEVADSDNDFKEYMGMPANGVPLGLGYSLHLCADVGQGEACWQSGNFAVVAKVGFPFVSKTSACFLTSATNCGRLKTSCLHKSTSRSCLEMHQSSCRDRRPWASTWPDRCPISP